VAAISVVGICGAQVIDQEVRCDILFVTGSILLCGCGEEFKH
jgi:hypothetical protein